MENTTERLDRASAYTLVILAVIQGYALYFLHLAIDSHAWPATDARWLIGLYTLAVGWPGFFYLGLARLQDRRNAWAGGPLALLLFGLGWHLGWLASGGGAMPAAFRIGQLLGPFVLSMGAALFILAFFFRTWTESHDLAFPYRRLLSLSWQNALTIGLLGLFVGVFWMLLWLLAFLFKILEVDFFRELFSKPGFAYPVTTLVMGLGLVLIRNRIRLIATVQFMCEVLIKALLPLAALIAVLFLAALPLTGIQRIWDTGYAGFLMMLLAVVLLFFFNAVLSETGEEPPYPAAIRWFVLGTMLILPINSVIAAIALYQRIDQYGLTDSRLWALILQVLIATYVFGSAVVILWRRGQFRAPLQRLNTILAAVLAATLLLVNTPLLDVHRIAADNQIARLKSGRTAVADIDLRYLRFELGEYGIRALHDLHDSKFAAAHPDLKPAIEAALKQKQPWIPVASVDRQDASAIARRLELTPADTQAPDSLLLWLGKNDSFSRLCLGRGKPACRLAAFTGPRGEPAWALFEDNYDWQSVAVYVADDTGGWRKAGTLNAMNCDCGPRPDHPGGTLERQPGPFVVYRDNALTYSFEPTLGYYQGTAAPGKDKQE